MATLKWFCKKTGIKARRWKDAVAQVKGTRVAKAAPPVKVEPVITPLKLDYIKSRYHIDGWLNVYECVSGIEGVRNVIHFGELLQGYEGPGVIKNEWGNVVFKVIDEVGLSDHPMTKRAPNDVWTEVVSEADWPEVKAYVEGKL